MNPKLERNPKVSIILPTYQRAAVLGRAVSDLLAQSFSDLEMFVMDDGSPDHTSAVIAAFHDPRLTYVREQHLGVPGIVNAAWERCRGEYVVICHDHDRYQPDFLAELVSLLDRHPTAAYAHCGIIEVDHTGTRQVARHVKNYPELIAGLQFLTDHLLAGLDSPVPAITLVRRSLLRGRFHDPQFGGCSDVELWMRLCLIGDAAYSQKTLLTLQQRDPNSAYYYQVHKLMEHVLNAKRLYLSHLNDPVRRFAIQRGWRNGADQTALACCLRAYRDGHLKLLPEIETFVRKEGTWKGISAMRLLQASPAWLSTRLLRGASSLRHFLNGPIVANKS